MSIWRELKERSVMRVAVLYLASSWLILQVADLVLDVFAVPDTAMQWLIAILALGLPTALALSWIYQWTPEGLKKEADVQTASKRRSPRGRLPLTLIILVALALGIYYVDTLIEPGSTRAGGSTMTPPPGSVAVLPFKNISDSEESDYFVDGLSIELLNLLAEVPGLRVTGRTSAFRYKDALLDAREIGAALGVAHILEGEVRKAQDQLRISVELIDTQTGYQVWRDIYDRTIDDIFDLQNEIAARTVDGLRVSILDEPPRARVTDSEAFDAYLNASYFYGLRGSENYARAQQLAEQAIAIDPEFAPAWTLLASTFVNQAIIGTLPFDDARQQARIAVENALQLEPEFSSANSARAWQAMYFDKDYVTAGRFFRRALQIAPGSAIVLTNAATFASTTGQLELAEQMLRGAMARDPVSPIVHLNYSITLAKMGRYSDAAASATRALELRPGMNAAATSLCLARLLGERHDEALRCIDTVSRPLHQHLLSALVHESLGDRKAAAASRAELVRGFSADHAFEIAKAFAWAGDADAAFDWLERAIAQDNDILGLKTDPLLATLYDDDRWQPLLTRLGLADDQIVELAL